MSVFVEAACGWIAGTLGVRFLAWCFARAMAFVRMRRAVDALGAEWGIKRLGWWETDECLHHRIALFLVGLSHARLAVSLAAKLQGVVDIHAAVVVPERTFPSPGGVA